MISDEKQSLRKRMRDYLRSESAGPSAAGSRDARRVLAGSEQWATARVVVGFCALPDELDLLDPWPEGKEIVLPRVEGERLVLCRVGSPEDLRVGAFGIREPETGCPFWMGETDRSVGSVGSHGILILVPGLAFGRDGSRLGRGKGYYDRLLASLRGFRLGVCRDGQVLDIVPNEAHDARVDALLTPSGLFPCGR